MSTMAAKPKAMTKPQRAQLAKWLRFYDMWLWSMRVSPYDAARFAKEDGLDFVSPRRMSILANKPDVCERWRVEKTPVSVRTLLNSDQWHRVMLWVENNKAEIQKAGCVVAANTMARRAGVVCSDSAMGEAMRARSVNLPLRSDRPKYADLTPAVPQ